VQESVGRSLGEGRVLDIFAQDARTLLLAASEEVPAVMMIMALRRHLLVMRRRVLVLLAIEIVWHCFFLLRFRNRNSFATPPSGRKTRVEA
jgi:hypothetical protein